MAYHGLAVNVRDDQRELEKRLTEELKAYKKKHKHVTNAFDVLFELVYKGLGEQVICKVRESKT